MTAKRPRTVPCLSASVIKTGSGGKDKDTELAAFQSIYDKAGRESVFAYYTDGKAYRTEFGYTSDDKAVAATLPTGGTFRRTYDGFDRVTKDAFTPQDKPETG